jgi:hypothetical protein
VLSKLTEDGFVVLDGVLAPALAQRALDGARALHEAGLLHAGMLEYIIFILNVLQVYTQSKYLYRMGHLPPPRLPLGLVSPITQNTPVRLIV